MEVNAIQQPPRITAIVNVIHSFLLHLLLGYHVVIV